MRKTLCTILLSLLIITFPFTVPVMADDHKLEHLHINVFIDEDGSATITEKRKAYLSEGTENYDIIENLGKSTITDFVVKEDGVTYDYVDDWDIDASREEKAFKNGLIETSNGYELAWGIGEYGAHEYIVQYKVTDFIKQLQDSQILFWRFVNDQTNTPPESLTIEVETGHPMTAENEKIWAFGFEGDINFSEGKVVANSSKPLKSHNYATILIKFPDKLFQTEDVINKSFTDVQDEAFDGSDYGKEEEESASEIIFVIFIVAALIGLPFILLIVFFTYEPYKRNKELRRLKSKYEGQYNRDLPSKRNFVDLFYLLQDIKEANINSLITAFILKWLYEERVSVETKSTGTIRKKDKVLLHFHHVDDVKNDYERRLLNLLSEAAGPSRVLEQGDYVAWTEENKERYIKWEKDIKLYSRDKLERLGYIKLSDKKSFLISEQYVLTEQGKEVQVEVYQFANYLRDFSLLHEHEAVNVKIWDELMIWAAVLQLTDVVSEQFKTLYPKYAEETVYPLESLDSISTFSAYISIANMTSSDSGRNSGGGGFTSTGGGGGSFGGGSGGGTR